MQQQAVAPLAAHVQLMDRSLPYQACMDDLEEKLKTKAATDVAAKKETRAEGPAKKAPVVFLHGVRGLLQFV